MRLARKWSAQRADAFGQHRCHVSPPVVIIDDAWLRGDRGAAPPHVYTTLWRNGEIDPTGTPAARDASGDPVNPPALVVVKRTSSRMTSKYRNPPPARPNACRHGLKSGVESFVRT